jgi:chemotaxis protein MotB
MARKKKHEEHVNHERWLVSYADFITLLFAFFVVMFAASNADEQKAGQVAQAVQVAFSELAIFTPGGKVFSLSDGTGVSDQVGVVGNASGAFSGTHLISMMSDHGDSIQEVEHQLEAALVSEIEDGAVRLSMDERGLTISLAEAGFFGPGSAEIDEGGIPVLDDIILKIMELPYDMRIEGHTDDVPISTERFPSNWELSTARATTVLRYMISNGKVPPSRLSAIGYGEYRPVADNETPEGRGMNRRVDIVVMNTAMDMLEPKALAERSLLETGMPSVFLESAPEGTGPDGEADTSEPAESEAGAVREGPAPGGGHSDD